ncbi:FAD-dependent oxidoreductase [Myxococcota bacterium]|nr:FAD-dependent oxidoreductase [Myxococcota bacterium]
MRIGVVGAGAAGLVSAWLLQDAHDVVLVEAGSRPGGHAETAQVEVDGGVLDVELGPQFFFREGYGGLHALLNRLGLAPTLQRISMSVTLGEPQGTLALPPLSLPALGQLLNMKSLGQLLWFVRFGWGGEAVIREQDWTLSVQGLVDRLGAPRDAAEGLIIPLVAASWGVSVEQARALSAYSVARVMGLRPTRLPHTHTVPGGLGAYAHALVTDSPRLTLRLNSPARALRPLPEGGLALDAGDRVERFDAVILACDWRASAAACRDAPALAEWSRAFAAFEDYDTTIAVHRDPRLMPPDRRLWQVGNADLVPGRRPRNTVWSGVSVGADLFRTWLRPGEDAPPGSLETRSYKHVLMTTEHHARQQALARLQGQAGVWAAGMYTDGVDNHESAIRSAVKVAQAFDPEGERLRWLAERVSV